MKITQFFILMLIFGSCGNQPQKEKAKNKMDLIDISNLDKSSEMLEEARFWEIVATSLKNSNGEIEQEVILINEIAKLSPKEMIGFRLRTDKLLYDTYNSEMWCAGYIMNGGCSDDGFEYFRNWIISTGKKSYYQAKENPDNLISEVSEGKEFYEFESFWYVALEAFKKKTEKDLYDYIDTDSFKTSEKNYQQFEFNWQEEKPETMKAICPRLFAKLWD